MGATTRACPRLTHPPLLQPQGWSSFGPRRGYYHSARQSSPPRLRSRSEARPPPAVLTAPFRVHPLTLAPFPRSAPADSQAKASSNVDLPDAINNDDAWKKVDSATVKPREAQQAIEALLAKEDGAPGINPKALQAMFKSSNKEGDVTELIGPFTNNLSGIKLVGGLKQLLLHVTKGIQDRALRSRLVDPPTRQILLVIKGAWTAENSFHLGAFHNGPRLNTKVSEPQTPVLIPDSSGQYASAGAYERKQYTLELCPMRLLYCLQGFGLVLHCLPPCYHDGFDNFVSLILELQAKLIGRYDVVWALVQQVFAEQSRRLYHFLNSLGESEIRAWDSYSPETAIRIEELRRDSFKLVNSRLTLIHSLPDDAQAPEDWMLDAFAFNELTANKIKKAVGFVEQGVSVRPASPHHNGEGLQPQHEFSNKAVNELQAELKRKDKEATSLANRMGNQDQQIAALKKKVEAAQSGSPKGKGDKGKRTKPSAQETVTEQPGRTSPGTCRGSTISKRDWYGIPALKPLCFEWAVEGKCQRPGGEICRKAHTGANQQQVTAAKLQ